MDSKETTNDPHHEEVEVVSTNLAGKDRAAQLLRQVDHPIHVTQADNARVLRKIDLTILPILLTVYCLQYLDKATLSYASVFGLLKDTHLHGEDYSWLGSIVYVAQLVFQPLIAYLLVKLPIGKFAATMVLGWGAILCCMVAATTFKGLMAARFFLGAFEASVGKRNCSPTCHLEDTANETALLHSSNLCRHHSDVVETKRTDEQGGSLVLHVGGRQHGKRFWPSRYLFSG
jgi:hypothetical protein